MMMPNFSVSDQKHCFRENLLKKIKIMSLRLTFITNQLRYEYLKFRQILGKFNANL